MFLLVDLDNKRALAKHESYLGVAALAYIQFANADTAILNISYGENKTFTVLDGAVLRGMAEALGTPAPAGASYGAIVKHVRALVEAADYLVLPFPTEQLYRQAASIPPSSSTPFAFNPASESPDKLVKWHSPPYRNRSRHESAHWVHFSNAQPPGVLSVGQNSASPWNAGSGDATMPTRASRANTTTATTETDMAAAKKNSAPKAPAKKAAKAPAAPKPEKAAKAPKAPKEKVERVEQNGVKRPKAGTTGDKIWSTADSLSAKKKSPASFEEVSSALGESVNEASQRAGYQRWRKFNGLKGRLPAAE